MSRRHAVGVAGAIALSSLLLGPSMALAQAWVTPRGEGSVTLAHQFIGSTDHLTRTGERNPDAGRETLHVTSTDVVYGVTDRISAEVSLVWLATKWIGRPEDRHGPLDTGSFHGSFQDMRASARYQLVEGRVNVAPFVAFGGPVTDYETRGHSAFGRHLEELTLGTSVGGGLFGFGYWQAIGSYAFVNDIDSEDLSLDHLNYDVETGVMIGSRLTARVFSNGQGMRDGLRFTRMGLTDHLHLRTNHDRFARSSFINAGIGVTAAISPRFDVGLTAYRTLMGRNFHALNALVTHVSWKYGGGFSIAPAVSEVPTR